MTRMLAFNGKRLFANYVSPACDLLARQRLSYRQYSIWSCSHYLCSSSYTIWTTSRDIFHTFLTKSCRRPGYWTSSRSRWIYRSLTPSASHRRFRGTRPQWADTCQPHRWWRTSSIQPSTTHHLYAESTHRHTLHVPKQNISSYR